MASSRFSWSTSICFYQLDVPRRDKLYHPCLHFSCRNSCGMRWTTQTLAQLSQCCSHSGKRQSSREYCWNSLRQSHEQRQRVVYFSRNATQSNGALSCYHVLHVH